MIHTKHGYKRAKKRLGLSKKAVDRLVIKVLEVGEDYRLIEEQNAIGKIYGENIYVFNSSDKKLVTVYRMDNRTKETLRHD